MQRPEGENKMGVMPVNRLLLNMAIPIMISMLVQALYNVVDSYFVAQVSQDALNAVSLAFPVQNLMIAVSVGTGVGLNALLSRSLGQGNQEMVNRSAVNGLFLIFLSSMAFVVLGLTCSRLFYTAQTDIPGIIEYGADYLTICCSLSLGLFTAVCMERMLQATGRTFYTMIAQAVGALTNIILDPILIFGLGPFPRMEVAGAALATVIGQFLGCGVGVFFNLTRNPDIQLSFRAFRPHWPTIKAIYSVGLPGIVMQSIGSVMVFGMNQILIAFTDTATAVFGVYFKLQSFFFMPVFGLCNGMVPIVAYNFGARKPDRIVKTIRLSVMYATILMAVGFAVFQLFPATLLDMFRSKDDLAGDLIAIGVPALRIISFSWLLAGFGIICSSVFQALDHGVLSLVSSLVRQLIVLLPAAFLLARLFQNLDVVWLAFPLAELFSCALCAGFIRRVYRRDILPLRAPQAG
ncbi:MAG: MATE family efflux transporter [Oscillospiraceae bacterium]|nr:MATE family efflux transporter [Oscillospiraceae bacterium]